MSLIEVESLTKKFKVPIKEPGLKGAIKHLFRPAYREKTAVEQINLNIESGESVAYVAPTGPGNLQQSKCSQAY